MLIDPSELYVSTFFARQPIFAPGNKIWGYELLYRHSPKAEAALFEDSSAATLNVLVNSISSPCSDVLKEHNIVVNFPPRCIVQRVPYALPPSNVVIQISENAPLPDPVVASLLQLKVDGYTLAVDDYQGRFVPKKLLEVTDILIVDLLNAQPDRIHALLLDLGDFSGQLLAKRVETNESYALARHLGFTLFQGFFFQRPILVAGRKLTATEMARMNCIKAIEDEEPDFEAIAEQISLDVSLSYRLLRLINSAAFGLAKKVGSIKQAMVILGLKQLKEWLRLVLLTELAPTGKSSELPYLSVLRARFLHDLAQKHRATAPDPDSLYLLGLFSLLEPILDLPAAEILQHLPLEKKLVKALCRESSPYTSWLDVARCFETGNFSLLDALSIKLKLDSIVTAQAYFTAVRWTKAFFEITETVASPL